MRMVVEAVDLEAADMTVAETEVVALDTQAVDVEEVAAEDVEVVDAAVVVADTTTDINLSSNMHLNLYLSLNFKILHFNQSLPFSLILPVSRFADSLSDKDRVLVTETWT